MTQAKNTNNTENQAPINEDEIKRVFDQVIEHLYALNTISGQFTSFDAWLDAVQQKDGASLTHPRLSLFGSFYGDLATGDAKDKARQTIEAILGDNHMVNEMSASMDADLRLFEMSDLKVGETFTPNQIAHAVSFGMMVAEQGLDLHLIGGVGIGYEGVFKALDEAIKDDDAGTMSKDAAVDFLFNHAGDDVAAMCGVIVASRLARTPVMIYDQAGMAALTILAMMDPILVQNCAFVGPVSCSRQAILEKAEIFTVGSNNDVFPGENAFLFVRAEKDALNAKA